MKKLICLLLDHDFETRLIKGKREVNVAGMKHEYDSIVDVKLVCKCCGLITDRKTLVYDNNN